MYFSFVLDIVTHSQLNPGNITGLADEIKDIGYGAENRQNLAKNLAILQFLQISTDLSLPPSP